MTEEEVRERGIRATKCGIARFRETSRGHIMGLNSGMMKMIFALDDPRACSAPTSSARARPS